MSFSTSPNAAAEFSPMPQNGQRCPITGLSRATAYTLEREGLIRIKHIRRPGKLKGRSYIEIASVREYFARATPPKPRANKPTLGEAGVTDAPLPGEEHRGNTQAEGGQ
jgi:hypothetical protein